MYADFWKTVRGDDCSKLSCCCLLPGGDDIIDDVIMDSGDLLGVCCPM